VGREETRLLLFFAALNAAVFLLCFALFYVLGIFVFGFGNPFSVHFAAAMSLVISFVFLFRCCFGLW